MEQNNFDNLVLLNNEKYILKNLNNKHLMNKRFLKQFVVSNMSYL